MLVTFYEVGYFAMFGSRQTCMSQTEMGRTRQKCTYRSLTEMCSSRQRCKNPDRGVQIPDRGVQCQTEVYRSDGGVQVSDRGVQIQTEVYRSQSVQIQTEVCGSKMEVYRSRQRCTGPIERCTGPRQTEVYRSRQSWHILIFCHGVMVTLPCLAGCFAM